MVRNDAVRKWQYKGYDLSIYRAASGNYCGYVAIPKAHLLYGVDYDDPAMSGFPVHGGVTFTDYDDDGYWLVGFDCAHGGDYIPGVHGGDAIGLHIWSADEVASETEKLADELDRWR